MFTGLIEKTTTLEEISINDFGAKLTFSADFENTKLGESICVNGVCLTVSKKELQKLTFDVMRETLNSSNLKYLKKGDILNLERAMSVNSRFDGSIVTGHIDETIKVQKIIQDGFSKRVRFYSKSDLFVYKGSIVLNGVSLTVSNVFEDGFEVALIPTTIENTNLKDIKENDIINVEYDIFAKYIRKFTSPKKEISLEFLKEAGFV